MEQAKPKKKKKGLIALIVIGVLLILIIVGIVACSRALSASLEQLSAGLIELSEVEKRDISDVISVSGQVESENIVKITSTLTAKVKSIPVEIGSEVQEGDILCEFDSTDIQQQYDQLLKQQQNAEGLSANTHRINERNLQNAMNDRDTSLAQAQRAIDDANAARDKAYEKEQQLVDQYNDLQSQKGTLQEQIAASQDPAAAELLAGQYQGVDAKLQSVEAQLEALREQFATYDSAVRSAEDAYTAAQRSADTAVQGYQDILDNEQYSNDSTATENELKKLSDMLEKCTVRAPKSGIITSMNIAEGSIPTTDALMTIENSDALKITVSIAEQDILRIHEGMPAVVKTNATGEEEFKATVTRVVNIYKGSSSNALGQMTTEGGYSAEVTIDDKQNDLLIGMNAKVRIILNEKKDVLAVPYESIIEDEDGSCHVLLGIQQPDGTTRAKAAKVEKGMEGSYYTEITSDEVKEGDKVVVTPGDYKDGDVLPIFDFNASVNTANSMSDEGGANE